MKKSNSTGLILSILILLVGGVSCKSTLESTQGEESETAGEKEQEISRELINGENLDKYRSHLKDLHATQRHDYPERFNIRETENKEGRTDNRGYRIQLVSTRNSSIADSTKVHFQRWLQENPTTYRPRAYESFNQPHYRVHLGDFQVREKAIQYARLIKEEFPGAWVVHDRIKPNRSPADTLEIAISPDSSAVQPDTLQSPVDSLESQESDTLRR